MNVEKLNETADTLEWLAGVLRRAAAGERGAQATVLCFTHDWCGMTVFGPAMCGDDAAPFIEACRVAFEEEQAEDREEAEHACKGERA